MARPTYQQKQEALARALAQIDAVYGPNAEQVRVAQEGGRTPYVPKKKKDRGGGGGWLDTGPLGFALDVLDVPRAALYSTAKELSDLTGGSMEGEQASFGDWWNQIVDDDERILAQDIMYGNEDKGIKAAFGGLFGESSPEEEFAKGNTAGGIGRTAAGIGVDILTDPLTYVGVGLLDEPFKGAKATERTGEAVKAARAAAEAQTASRHIDDILNALDEGGDLSKVGSQLDIAEETQQAARAAADRVLAENKDLIERATRYGKGGLSNAEIEALWGIKPGLRFRAPGTGRIGQKLIPGVDEGRYLRVTGRSEKAANALAKGRKAVGDFALGRGELNAVGKILAGADPNITEALRYGTSKTDKGVLDAYTAAQVKKFKAVKNIGAKFEEDNALRAWDRATEGLDDATVAKALQGDTTAIASLGEKFAPVRQWYDNLLDRARTSGVDIQRLEDYAPHILTPEARRILGATVPESVLRRVGGADRVKAFFQHARTLTPNEEGTVEFLGKKWSFVNNQDNVERATEALQEFAAANPALAGDIDLVNLSLFRGSAREQAGLYARSVIRRSRLNDAVQKLADVGIGSDAHVWGERLTESSQAIKKAALKEIRELERKAGRAATAAEKKRIEAGQVWASLQFRAGTEGKELTNGLVRLQTLVRNKHLTVEEAVAKWREWREASAFKRTLFSAEDAPVPAGWTATKHSLVDDELTISMDDPFGNSQAMLIAKINDGGRLRIENLFNSTGGGPFGQKPVTGLASRMMDEMYREAADRGLIVIHNNLTPQGTEFLKRYLWKRPNVAGQTKVELGYMGYGPQGVVSGEEWLKPHFKALRAKYGARDAQELVGIQTDRIVAQLSALGVPDNQILARIGEMSEAELVRLQQIARDQRLVLEMPSHHGIDSGPLGDKARPKIQLDEAVIRGRLSPEEAQQLRRERWAELKIDADYQEAQAIAHGQMADEQRDIIAALQTETFRRNSAWAKQQLDQTLGAEVKSGLITPSEAAHVLMRTEEMLEPNALLSQLRKVTGWVRSWQIATPGFVNRNIMGGMWNNGYYGESGVPMKAYREWMDLMHGVGPGETEPAILKLVAGKARKRLPELTPEQVVRRDEVLEAIGKGQVGSEYGHVQSWINQDRKANWLVPSSNHVIPYAIRSANERAEAVMRGALAYQVLEDGGKVEDATQWVIKLHFDYEDLSRAEKSLKNTFVPFYTYTRRNFPLQMEMLFAKPKTFARYKHFMDNMEAASPESELYIPGYYGREQFIPTPWSNEGGQMFLAPDLPFKDVNRMFDMATGDMGDNPVAPFQMVSPIFKAPLEYWAGKQSFKGLPLRGWEKPVALPDQLSFMGNALERAGRAKKRNGKWWVAEKDYWGLGQYLPPVGQVQRLWPADPKKQDKLTTSWLSWFGFGTRTLTVDDSEAAQYFEQEKKPLDVDREIDRELERYNKR